MEINYYFIQNVVIIKLFGLKNGFFFIILSLNCLDFEL